jgi:hypothetical protein
VKIQPQLVVTPEKQTTTYGDKNLSVATIAPEGKYKIIRLEFQIKFHCYQINSRNEANNGPLELNATYIRII